EARNDQEEQPLYVEFVFSKNALVRGWIAWEAKPPYRAPLKTTCVVIAALKTGSKCSFTARKLRFFAYFCLALTASPTFLEVPYSGLVCRSMYCLTTARGAPSTLPAK
ncbi:hypothetical protein ACFFGX_21300, partial [Azorhizophilus paspali]